MMNVFTPITSNNYEQESSKCVFINAQPQPKPTGHISTTTSTVSTVSNLKYGNSTNEIGNSTTVTNSIQEDSIYAKYTFRNTKEFREKYNVTNAILEKIWDANFKKKNGYCPNCNIYGICKPINNKCLHNPRKFPPGLVVSTVENPTKEEDFTFICYKCYNEHLQIPECMIGATAPMDVNDGNHNMYDEYMNIFNKYNKK